MGITRFGGSVRWPSVKEQHTPVVLRDLDDEALLSVVTQEILGLLYNFFDPTLQPTRMILA